jgi:hypothetical protein
MQKSKSKIAKAIFIVAIANFALFAVISLLMLKGGSAFNGKFENGIYYVGEHGNYYPVAPWIYWYSSIHNITLCISHPLGMLAGGYLHIMGKKGER